MSLYEIIDSYGKTVMELGRFESDESAIRVARNVLVFAKNPHLVRKTGLGRQKVAPLPNSYGDERKVLEDLLDLCVSSKDSRIADLAKQYRRISA